MTSNYQKPVRLFDLKTLCVCVCVCVCVRACVYVREREKEGEKIKGKRGYYMNLSFGRRKERQHLWLAVNAL